MKKLYCILLSLFPLFCCAQDSLNVLFYNLYRFPVNTPANREYLLQQILKVAQPDLLMACEIVNKDGADRILNTSFNLLPDSFAAPQFVYCTTATADPLQQMVFYNTRKLTLLHQAVYHTIIRDINHYTFCLNQKTLSGDSIFLDAFVTHLKAGMGSTNSWLRETMADTFVKALQHVPQTHHVLLAGDFNFYNDDEPAYQVLTDTSNPIIMVDPVPSAGDWHENPDFRAIHTQATRKTLDGFGLGGASGGMDDRFDFILMSQNLKTDNSLYYLPGSYKTFGNNGDCFNRAINNDSCTGVYALPLRNLLFQMSDHAPVIMTMLTPGQFPTSVNEGNAAYGKSLFYLQGNVVDQKLSLLLNGNKQHSLEKVIIYDLTGRKLRVGFIPASQKQFVVDLQNLSSGMYFVRMGNQVERFVKR